jgi:hypothetical protein
VEEVTVSLTEDGSLRSVIEQVTASERLETMVNWDELQGLDVEPDTALGINGQTIPLPRLLRMLASRFDDGHDALDWRFGDAYLEIGTRRMFDLRERALASYDVGDVLGDEIGEQELCDLMYTFVSADDWHANGGDLGQLQLLGTHLFVEAPPRMHERVQWLLEQLARGAGPDGGPRADASPDMPGRPGGAGRNSSAGPGAGATGRGASTGGGGGGGAGPIGGGGGAGPLGGRGGAGPLGGGGGRGGGGG